MGMIVYSALLSLALGLAAPWWGWRMLRSGRYRAGLSQRLGRVPAAVRAALAGKRVVWVHAVSVGEVLAVVRLVEELQTALGARWIVALSTTTATGQAVARARFAGLPVFFFPLDFAFAARAWMRVLRPQLLVLVEGELWPRVLQECARRGTPVVVVNARLSDRSYQRTMRVRRAWGWMARRVTLFLAQGPETAGRLAALGVRAQQVRVVGNLKGDLPPAKDNQIADWIRDLAGDRPVIVAGSTLGAEGSHPLDEEHIAIQAWSGIDLGEQRVLLVLAPRHPDRFGLVASLAAEYPLLKASEAFLATKSTTPFEAESRGSVAGKQIKLDKQIKPKQVEAGIVLLDTLGDLAAVYAVARVAFIGGSLVPQGGHNPLEAARFGVPIVMGSSYENFREVVDGLRDARAIDILAAKTQSDPVEALRSALTRLLQNDEGMGARGQAFFEQQAGATERTVAALLDILEQAGMRNA